MYYYLFRPAQPLLESSKSKRHICPNKLQVSLRSSLIARLAHAQPRINVTPGSVISNKADKQTAVDIRPPFHFEDPLLFKSMGFVGFEQQLAHLATIAPTVDRLTRTG